MIDIVIRIRSKDGEVYEATCIDPTVEQMDKWQKKGLENVSPLAVISDVTGFDNAKKIPFSLAQAILSEWAEQIQGKSKNYRVIRGR